MPVFLEVPARLCLFLRVFYLFLPFYLSTEYENCAQLYKSGKTISGVYTINPDGAGPDFEVFCDQKTAGGGWIVVQKRLDGTVDFHRNWSDYKNGFGNFDGEFWLGLDKIHRLTNSLNKFRVDLEDFDSNTAYAEYDMFLVANESKKYQLSVKKYSGKWFEANKSNCFDQLYLADGRVLWERLRSFLVICIQLFQFT